MDIYDAVMSEDQNKKLVVDFTFEEFFVALKQMHLNKSAVSDGLNLTFYQQY